MRDTSDGGPPRSFASARYAAIHRLFDQGYVTVTPDLRFRVSSQIRDRFHNGVIYYQLEDHPVTVPDAADQRPDPSALEWHSSAIFKP